MQRLNKSIFLTLLTIVGLIGCGSGGGGGTGGGTVDTTAPQVLNTSPADGATGIAADQVVTVTFSEAINCATVSTANVRLLEATNPIPVQVRCSGASVSLWPTEDMPTNTTLTATMDPSVRDLAGNTLADTHVWSFDMASWTRQLGSVEHEFAYATSTDADGNVYMAGSTQGALDGGTNAGFQDIFVIKYNASGVQQWLRQLGTAGDEQARALAVDADGNVYLTGYTEGAFDGQSNVGYQDIFIVKYDTNGMQQWLHQLGTSTNDQARALTADADGNVYLAGYTEGDLDGQGNAGNEDIFVIKYDASGVQQWIRQLGTAGIDAANGITADADGNVYAAGETNYNLDSQTVASGNQLFVIKYDASGAQQWVRQLGVSGGGAFATTTITDSAGNVYAGGYTTGALGDQTYVGSYDLFIIKYDTSGVQQWVRQLGTSTNEQARALTADADGNVYAAGYTIGNLDGQGSAGAADIFITKYDGSGVQQWIHQIGTSGHDITNGLAADTRGNLYIAGHTYGDLDGLSNAGLFDPYIVKYRMDGRKR